MNLSLLLINGLIFSISFYLQSQASAANWFFIFTMIFSSATIVWVMGAR
jgi:hypothetical protein